MSCEKNTIATVPRLRLWWRQLKRILQLRNASSPAVASSSTTTSPLDFIKKLISTRRDSAAETLPEKWRLWLRASHAERPCALAL